MTARLEKAKIRLTRQLLKFLFLPKPEFHMGEQSVKAYEEIYSGLEGDKTRKDVVLPHGIPAIEFFDFLENKQEFLFHGSNQLDLDILTLKKQNNFRGDEVNGVFASSDPIWAMFFAIINREKYTGTLRNGSFVVSFPQGVYERYYFFSINNAVPENNIWNRGAVYILPREKFKPAGDGWFRFDEWICYEPVIPTAKITIEPEDFPMLGKVVTHQEQESIYLSWVTYKWRLRNRSGGDQQQE